MSDSSVNHQAAQDLQDTDELNMPPDSRRHLHLSINPSKTLLNARQDTSMNWWTDWSVVYNNLMRSLRASPTGSAAERARGSSREIYMAQLQAD